MHSGKYRISCTVFCVCGGFVAGSEAFWAETLGKIHPSVPVIITRDFDVTSDHKTLTFFILQLRRSCMDGCVLGDILHWHVQNVLFLSFTFQQSNLIKKKEKRKAVKERDQKKMNSERIDIFVDSVVCCYTFYHHKNCSQQVKFHN